MKLTRQTLVDATGALISSVVALSLILTAFAQDPPSLPDKNRAAILEIQLRMEKTKNQYDQMFQQFLAQPAVKQLQDQFAKDQSELLAAQVDACKAAKADCEKGWTLNPITLKFEAKPQPPVSPPTTKK